MSKHLHELRTIFAKWEQLLGSMTEAEIRAPRLAGGWAVRDVIAHLMSWQQISIAYLEAARQRRDPEFPEWLGGAHPLFAEEHRDEFNARIYERYRVREWTLLHEAWRSGFQRFLELGGAIADEELEGSRPEWLQGFALVEVLEGSREHHEEHYQSLRRRLDSPSRVS